MINSDKKSEEKYCNCKNSKCIKLYCECFAAHRHCGKNCRCLNCHNTSFRDPYSFYKQPKLQDARSAKEQAIKNHKGCACKKSGCTKKYCECFQAGLSCTELCKCMECQNNQSMSNKNIILQLRKNMSQKSNKPAELYSLYLSQNSDQLNTIIGDHNPLSLKEDWLEGCAKQLYQSAKGGSPTSVLDSFLEILRKLEEKMVGDEKKSLSNDESLSGKNEEISQKMQIQNEEMKEEIVLNEGMERVL